MRALIPWMIVACAPVVDVPVDVPVDPEGVAFPISEVDLTRFVDPFVGTRGGGNTIPGAVLPHGMVRASPDTWNTPGAIDAYEWDNTRIEGFSHTHLEGPGGSANGYSQILLLPQSGPLVLNKEARAQAFDHDDEDASPGWYRVHLTDSDVEVQLTATGHAAIHRYTFPAGPARVLIDLGHSLGSSTGGEIVREGSVVRGFGRYRVHPFAAAITGDDGTTGWSTVYTSIDLGFEPSASGTFADVPKLVEFADPLRAEGAGLGMWVELPESAPRTVELRVGISMISTDQAKRNVDAELTGHSFEDVAEAAEAAWNHRLNRVQVTGSDDEKTRFYTALYHMMLQPADYTEAGGVFGIGASGKPVTREAVGFRYYTDDWCAWDTFRTSHPLRTLVEPELADDFANSMLVTREEGGWLDKCPWHATGYSRVMTGNPQVPILVDAYVKGLYGDRVDEEQAWQALDALGTTDVPPYDGLLGYFNLGTPAEYITRGYVPNEADPGQAASMTLEHAYADAVTGWFAAAAGRAEDANRYEERAGAWKNTWNDAVGFAQPRRRDGSWVEPFDPDLWGDFNGFTEATSWIYSFSVQHDLPGLVDKVGGVDAMEARLDAFFDGGRFDPGNQPGFHVPWIYAAIGRPAKSQARVKQILDAHYAVGPDGLPGNDDAGALSAYALMAILGLYPIAPGDPTWTIAAPRIQEATLHLHPGFFDGGSFTVRAVGDPAADTYVQSATWNGETLQRAALTHDQIVGGGVLEVVLGPEPSTWAEE